MVKFILNVLKNFLYGSLYKKEDGTIIDKKSGLYLYYPPPVSLPKTEVKMEEDRIVIDRKVDLIRKYQHGKNILTLYKT